MPHHRPCASSHHHHQPERLHTSALPKHKSHHVPTTNTHPSTRLLTPSPSHFFTLAPTFISPTLSFIHSLTHSPTHTSHIHSFYTHISLAHSHSSPSCTVTPTHTPHMLLHLHPSVSQPADPEPHALPACTQGNGVSFNLNLIKQIIFLLRCNDNRSSLPQACYSLIVLFLPEPLSFTACNYPITCV